MTRFLGIVIVALLIIFSIVYLVGTATSANPNEPLIRITRGDVQTLADNTVNATESIAKTTTEQVEDFLNRLFRPPQNTLVQVLMVTGGIILLLFGWRIYDVIVVLAGALVGASIATAAVVTTSVVMEVAALLIGAFIGALLAMFLYYIAVFIVGMYVGILVLATLARLLGATPISPIVILIGAILGGFILLALSAEFVIFISALVGAQMIATGFGLQAEWMLLFAIIGIIVQFSAIRIYNIDLRRRPRRRWLRA